MRRVKRNLTDVLLISITIRMIITVTEIPFNSMRHFSILGDLLLYIFNWIVNIERNTSRNENVYLNKNDSKLCSQILGRECQNNPVVVFPSSSCSFCYSRFRSSMKLNCINSTGLQMLAGVECVQWRRYLTSGSSDPQSALTVLFSLLVEVYEFAVN